MIGGKGKRAMIEGQKKGKERKKVVQHAKKVVLHAPGHAPGRTDSPQTPPTYGVGLGAAGRADAGPHEINQPGRKKIGLGAV